MYTEDPLIDDCGDRKEVEKFHELCPDVCATVLSDAFSLETISLSDLS